jgi:starch synthase
VLGQAVYTYQEHRDAFVGVAVRGMQQDLGWDHAAYMYEQKLLEAKYAH